MKDEGKGMTLKTSKVSKDPPSIIKEVYSHRVLYNSKNSEGVVEKRAIFLGLRNPNWL